MVTTAIPTPFYYLLYPLTLWFLSLSSGHTRKESVVNISEKQLIFHPEALKTLGKCRVTSARVTMYLISSGPSCLRLFSADSFTSTLSTNKMPESWMGQWCEHLRVHHVCLMETHSLLYFSTAIPLSNSSTVELLLVSWTYLSISPF